MKTILLLYDFFSENGGIERVMYFQAKSLRKAGYNVKFAFAYVDDNLRREKLEGFEVKEYGKFLVRNETAQICSSIVSSEPVEKFKDVDLVVCHSFPASYLALRLKRKYGIPYLLNLHHPPQFLHNADLAWAKNSFKRKFSFAIGKFLRGPLRKFDEQCFKSADKRVVVSRAVKRIIHETYGLDVQDIVYPTVNPIFKIQKPNSRFLKEKGLVRNYVLGSGRIVEQKRFDYLIDAFSNLKESGLDLVLAGDYSEEYKRELEKLALKRGVKPLFLGQCKPQELVKLYNSAKVVVLTCPKEWFGLVPIEAMACGCPVVGWKDNFGPEETIVPGVNGYLAQPYSTQDLAKKISDVLKGKWNRIKINNSVRRFSEDSVSRKFISILSSVRN